MLAGVLNKLAGRTALAAAEIIESVVSRVCAARRAARRLPVGECLKRGEDIYWARSGEHVFSHARWLFMATGQQANTAMAL